MEILNIENLSFKYPGQESYALDNFSLSVNQGDFILLTGSSGSGKTTLIKLLNEAISPFGEKNGEIVIKRGIKTGIVTQDVETQIVSDTVWHNIAFALENEGLPKYEIRQKVAETAEFFDITHLFHKKTTQLSGGEKQLVTLASVMASDVDILLLDEPVSQLDPIAARNFIDMIKRLNSEMGITIIISEHKSEELINFATKICVMENGKLIAQGKGLEVFNNLDTDAVEYPFAVRLLKALGISLNDVPASVSDCRSFLRKNYKNDINSIEESVQFGEKALRAKDIYFRYGKNDSDVLKKLNFTAYKGEIAVVLGGNGAGKTSFMGVINNILKPYSGKVHNYTSKIVLLPQNVKTVFTKDVLKDDLSLVSNDYMEIADELKITHLLNRNPFDLSGGEAQKAALAKILLTNPEILCLDEPTKGIDAKGKREVGELLKRLKEKGMCIIAVTHDAEFSAEFSDRCVFLYDGQIVSEGTPRQVFSKNKFYTTTASIVSKGFFENTVTIDDISTLCKRNGTYQ